MSNFAHDYNNICVKLDYLSKYAVATYVDGMGGVV
jgi:hypothetical protein